MKIGYACINRTYKWTTGHTCKVRNATKEKLRCKIQENIDDLWKILDWNVDHDILFFRMGSQFIPLATHQKVANEFDWSYEFKQELNEFNVLSEEMRFSMHPDHFVVLNSLDNNIVNNSILELEYHAKLFDCMGLNNTHKMQIHGGGVFGNKNKSITRWIEIYNNNLSQSVKNRLVLENDDYRYSLKDCLNIHTETGVPILFDTLHHECLNNSETQYEAFKQVINTWKSYDGIPMIDYSSQEYGKRKGTHISHIDKVHFYNIIGDLCLNNKDMDIMLEIKDKELSALDILTT